VGSRTMICQRDLDAFLAVCNPQATNDAVGSVPGKGR